MNLRDLEYAVAVADHGHFGRAATACNVSQPTLSGQILKLEAELGLWLFAREGRAVRVDARAAGVIAEARAALAAAANVTAAAAASRDPFAGPLGCMITRVRNTSSASPCRSDQGLPLTPMHLIEDLTDRLVAGMAEGALDAAVIATDPGAGRLDAIELYEEPFYLVSARRPRARRRASIGVDEIDPKTLLQTGGGPLPARPGARALRRGGASRRGRRPGDEPRDRSPPRRGWTGRDAGAAARLRRLAAPKRWSRRPENRGTRRVSHCEAHPSPQRAPPRRDRGPRGLTARIGRGGARRLRLAAGMTMAARAVCRIARPRA